MRLLIIRFSALGDVAMSVPVVDSLARQHPELCITVLSKSFMHPLFAHTPDNVSFKGVNLNDYKGIVGLFKLYEELKKERFDAVADIHDVIRTKILRFFFRLSGVKTAHIQKGRSEKKALCKPNSKKLKQLKSSFERYADVLNALGWHIKPIFHSIYNVGKGDQSLFKDIADPAIKKNWIGIAPFAAHTGKILPLATISTVISKLCDNTSNQIFLFGGGKKEIESLNSLAEGKKQVTVVAGRLSMTGELALMSHLDVMLSMDSANMHLASLTGIPVVSIWGATHPYAGFMGWGQQAENTVQVNLECRPCSIYGNKPCYRGDYACLKQIAADEILKKLYLFIPK
ncbi:MAG: glycosyltransferase family 9 protein [Bacteroidaceae bacterium]|nr:glycosyltransferase family 9 protein [Bacteroidaceae bacterium]